MNEYAIQCLKNVIQNSRACLRQAKINNGICECKQTTEILINKIASLKHSINILQNKS